MTVAAIRRRRHVVRGLVCSVTGRATGGANRTVVESRRRQPTGCLVALPAVSHRGDVIDRLVRRVTGRAACRPDGAVIEPRGQPAQGLMTVAAVRGGRNVVCRFVVNMTTLTAADHLLVIDGDHGHPTGV